jgi:flagellin
VVTSVNTNVNAMAAVQALSDISNQMSATQGAIESGLKVGSAADNPAVFTIAQGLRANVNALTAVSDSLSTSMATLGGQTAGATSISNALNALKTTVTQSEGLPAGSAALAATQAAVTNALSNIDAYAAATTINGVNMLDGTAAGLAAAPPSSTTTSFLSNVSGAATTVTVASFSDSISLGLTASSFAGSGFVDGTTAGTTAAIGLLDAAIKTIGATLTQLGSGTSQLTGLKSFTDQLNTSNTTSLGAMVDANLSEESAKLSSLQTKQSLAIQSLSIANQGPGALLQLFR